MPGVARITWPAVLPASCQASSRSDRTEHWEPGVAAQGTLQSRSWDQMTLRPCFSNAIKSCRSWC